MSCCSLVLFRNTIVYAWLGDNTRGTLRVIFSRTLRRVSLESESSSKQDVAEEDKLLLFLVKKTVYWKIAFLKLLLLPSKILSSSSQDGRESPTLDSYTNIGK